MSRLAIVSVAAVLMASAAAVAAEPIALRDMGSFHVGGRLVEISGKPVKEMVFTPGGVPAKVDPNGTYQVEQMYVQYFLPADRRGTVPLLMWHGGGLTGVTYETTPDGREGWLNWFLKKGWEFLHPRRSGARAGGRGHVSGHLQERAALPAEKRAMGPLPHGRQPVPE